MKKIHLPLSVGWNDRGHGHGDYAVLNKMGEPITIPFDYQEDAEFIYKAGNNHEELVEILKRILPDYKYLSGGRAECEAKIKSAETLLKELED